MRVGQDIWPGILTRPKNRGINHEAAAKGLPLSPMSFFVAPFSLSDGFEFFKDRCSRLGCLEHRLRRVPAGPLKWPGNTAVDRARL